MEYTNDIICTVEYINEKKHKRNLMEIIRQNKILSIAISLFGVLCITDAVLITSFMKILSTFNGL